MTRCRHGLKGYVSSAHAVNEQARPTAVEGCENPWLLRMKVNALHPLAAGVKLPLSRESVPIEAPPQGSWRKTRRQWQRCNYSPTNAHIPFSEELTLTSSFILAVAPLLASLLADQNRGRSGDVAMVGLDEGERSRCAEG